MRVSDFKVFLKIVVFMATCIVCAPASAGPKPRYDDVTEIVQTLACCYSFPKAINNHGVVVGSSSPSNDGQPFLYRNGVMEPLFPIIEGAALDVNDAGDVLLGAGFEAYNQGYLIRSGAAILLPLYPSALNNHGEVVGLGLTGDLINFSVVTWSNGVVRPLGGSSPGWASAVTDINDSAIAVGAIYQFHEYELGEVYETNHLAVMFRDDQTIPLGTLPGFAFSSAQAINDRGEIVGTAWTDPETARGFLYRAGSLIELGTLPGATEVRPLRINNLGHVIGYVEDARNQQRGFLYMNGVMHDLTDFIKPATDWTIFVPYAINDKDQIVGNGYKGSPDIYTFLLTPRKEPKPPHFKPPRGVFPGPQ